MGFWEIIYSIFIGPLELFFEVLYTIANRVIGNYGFSIIVLSIMMNFLVLPLYKRADAMQAQERDVEAKLHDGIAHIKKTFKDDEKMMLLQTYYRQNNYKSTDVFKSSVSLLLEIPFFIAAYHFLSNLECLKGVSFGPITDLGAPDGLLCIFGITINILPIIMTAVNVVSCIIYTKGFPLKTKIQLYAMALFFLIFLYTSPSGLVFYWTLNNIFSLVKTIFYKLKNPKKVLCVLAAIAGAGFIAVGALGITGKLKVDIFLAAAGAALIVPLIITIFKSRKKKKTVSKEYSPNKWLFLAGQIFLTVLAGLLIPSALVNASPQEFVDTSYYVNPIWYVVSSLCLAVGLFVVWLRVFYWLADKKGKCIFEKVIWMVGVCGLINYMFFGRKLGNLSSSLTFDNGLTFSAKEIILNVVICIAAATAVYVVLSLWQKYGQGVFYAGVLAILGMSVVNMIGINANLGDVKAQVQKESGNAVWTLSQNGKNVIVLMLDRAMGEYIPYIMNEKPELKEQFEGFTYYSNVVSFGLSTNFASPALFGGYEYTPLEINERDSESLKEKQNEALKVMPVLFTQNDFAVTVCDPPYAGYAWVPDLSIYDDYPEINSYITKGSFVDKSVKEASVKSNKRNFFCYSIMKIAPLFTQETLYNNGRYNTGDTENEEIYDVQAAAGTTVGSGISKSFIDSYNVLTYLSQMTEISDDDSNNFLMMGNETTHDVMILQEPEYTVSDHVDNTQYDAENTDRFTLNGKTLSMDNYQQVAHYHCNMAALIQVGKWLDYLKKNNVYDNTRIIIVSDHGRYTDQLEELVLDPDVKVEDLEGYYPLLLVKDFNSTGEFETSDEFMTNADVATIATEGVIEDPVNPFTGKEINSSEKYAHDQYIFGSELYSTTENNGNVFLPGTWLSVHDNIWDKSNWSVLQENSTSPFEEKD